MGFVEEGGAQHPHSLNEAEVERVWRVLHRYGALTRERLYEECANHWTHGTFKAALDQAVRQGRVRHLGGSIYEAVEQA